MDVARGSSGSGRAMSLETGDSSWLCWTKPVVARQNQLVGRDADGREVEAARPPSAMDRSKVASSTDTLLATAAAYDHRPSDPRNCPQSARNVRRKELRDERRQRRRSTKAQVRPPSTATTRRRPLLRRVLSGFGVRVPDGVQLQPLTSGNAGQGLFRCRHGARRSDLSEHVPAAGPTPAGAQTSAAEVGRPGRASPSSREHALRPGVLWLLVRAGRGRDHALVPP